MRQEHLKTVLILSIILSWLVIGANLYSFLADESQGSSPAAQPYFWGGSGNSTTYIVNTTGVFSMPSSIEMLYSNRASEKASPCQRIRKDQILVTDDRIVIEYPGAEWASFTDTNSMDPVLDNDSYALEYVPKSSDELCVGDIASYSSRYADGTVIHRVVEIGIDKDGWYAMFKGDNLPDRDPEKVRFSQIRRVVIGIIY